MLFADLVGFTARAETLDPEDVEAILRPYHERLRTVLKYIEAERVHVTPDCGFSQTARYIATKKFAAMVEGVRLVRQQLKITPG